ncbi:carbohydrate ABC transporter permease [Spirochaeta thermophila]|uniref:Transporter n=1 Tax=Winmispira thermophila (strain ATCC 49972 / DSM 6192 / RI 19.B1) TaxID=665571 RepID=E0RTU9_WINT6|nr:carbohydrate ABC transporter permease [Spirochaeta thermophila]ADN02474.1 transporter [Spirochaeta thermophila DSM 6192]
MFIQKQYGIIRDHDLRSPVVLMGYIGLILLCVFFVVVAFAPILWLFFASFKDIREFVREPTFLPRSFDFSRFVKTWNDLKFVRYYRNSLISVTGCVISAVFFNGLLAYALSKVRPRGSKLVFTLVLWSLLIPPTTSIVPLFMNIVRLGMVGTFFPIWFSFGANAFYVILFKNFFDTIPQSLVEASRLDGCNEFQIFRRVVLPLSRPIVMVVVIYAVNAAWSDFLLPYLVLTNSGLETVMVRLFQFRGSYTTEVDILRAIVFAVIPPVVLFVLFQKQITEMAAHSGIKG